MLEKDKIKTEWDFSIFISDTSEAAIQLDVDTSKKECEKFISKWKDLSFTENPEKLKLALDEYVSLMENYGTSGKSGFFAAFRTYLDQVNPTYRATYNKISAQSTKLGSEMEFFIHAVSRISPQKQNIFLADPSLSLYKNFLTHVFDRGKYLLSLDSEKILTLKSKVSYENWSDLSQNLLSAEAISLKIGEEKAQKVGIAKLSANLMDVSENVRNASAKALSKTFKKYEKVAEAEMNSILEDKRIDDELRGIARPDFTQHLENDLPSEAVDTLIKAVESKNYVSHKFYEIKAKLLNKEKLQYHERMIPFSSDNKRYEFFEGVNEVYELFNNFNPVAGNVVKGLLYNGQVDAFSKKGKYYSAFCTQVQKRIPQYVLLNFQNRFEDISTIAHEFGHAVNHHLTNEAQPYIYNGTPLCIAETASTFFESLLISKKLNEVDEKSRLAMLIDQMDDSISTVFRQIACYKFEQDLHRKFRETGYLSSDDIGELFTYRMQEYCGPFVEIGSSHKTWWVHWPHIRNYFYVFSYSFGHLLSKYLLKKYSDNPAYSKEIIQFLSSGVALPTLESLKQVGFDSNRATSWDIGLTEIEKNLEKLG